MRPKFDPRLSTTLPDLAQSTSEVVSSMEGKNEQAAKQATRPEFLTVEEIAEMLRVKPRTIYDMVAQNRIPYRKVGRRVVFLLTEILEWTDPSLGNALSGAK